MRSRRPPGAEDALASTVLDGALAVRRGESITIEAWSHALPWARAFVVEARRRGVFPTLVVEDENAFFRSIEVGGSPAVLESPRTPRGRGGSYVYLGGPEEFSRLAGLPAHHLAALTARHDRAWWRAARRNRMRAVRIAIADATAPAAARYGVTLEGWRAELLNASLVRPKALAESGRRLVQGLPRSAGIRVRHPNGTDLVLRRTPGPTIVESGRPHVGAGDVWAQVPSGLLVVPLQPGVAEGTWETNRPAYDRFARPSLAVGGRFDFRAGRLVGFEFDRGGEAFSAAYARAGRGRERPVALTVGLNPAIARAPEVVGLGRGILGLLLGDSPYRPGGERARFSFLATLSGADVEVNGRPWLVRGTRPVVRRS